MEYKKHIKTRIKNSETSKLEKNKLSFNNLNLKT